MAAVTDPRPTDTTTGKFRTVNTFRWILGPVTDPDTGCRHGLLRINAHEYTVVEFTTNDGFGDGPGQRHWRLTRGTLTATVSMDADGDLYCDCDDDERTLARGVAAAFRWLDNRAG